jgi:hypothetical protein
LLICFYDASDSAAILPSACAERAPRGMTGRFVAGRASLGIG